MKPQTKDLKAVTEKLEASARVIQWSQPHGPDALLIGARIFLPPSVISAITADFLLITSDEIFKTRVRDWKYAEDFTQALWNITKVLVADLSKQLKTRHEEALEKQRDARVHKYLVTNRLAHITGVRLVFPNAVRDIRTNAEADNSTRMTPITGSVEAVGVRAVILPEDFYAAPPPRRKRKAKKSSEEMGSPKRRKTMASVASSTFTVTHSAIQDKENTAPRKGKKGAAPAPKKIKSAPKKS
ncbi:hypothetical protein B0H15DRAFT_807151 [Mycena belliarum]|uniref:Uncharacterized protein n=1 Tax=Mycena belliarum TaxID=1033014 RepID=A0AAD6TPB7_9AGAR|nr:hypothetical protein B0H15DRAFT_807151 [Mycena belliae]